MNIKFAYFDKVNIKWYNISMMNHFLYSDSSHHSKVHNKEEMSMYMVEGTKSFEEKKELLGKLMKQLDAKRISYELKAQDFGGCWVRIVEVPELDLHVELAEYHKVLNSYMNGSIGAWCHKGGSTEHAWTINSMEDFERDKSLKGKIL